MALPTDQDVFGTSEWIRGHAANMQRFSDILAKYGIADPSKGENQSELDKANPYSIAAQIAGKRDYGYGQDNYSANSHNALFSGAFQNSIDQTGRDYTQNIATAGQNELGEQRGVGQADDTLYQTVYGQLLGQPAAPDPTPPPPPPTQPTNLPTTAGASIGGNTGTPVPQTPYPRQGPEAGSAPKNTKNPGLKGATLGVGH